MKLRYGLEDRPPLGEALLYALQWAALSLPFVVLLGTVAADRAHPADAAFRTLYLQKAAFAAALMILSQALVGHRLPLVAGASTALLLGIVGTEGSPDAVYTASALCGVALAALSAAGFLRPLVRLFSPRVISAVILLIAFTMIPTVVRLLAGGGGSADTGRLPFAVLLVAALFLAHRLLPAAARSLLVAGGMAVGSGAYFALYGNPGGGAAGRALLAPFFRQFTTPVLDGGALLSFLFCYLALFLNEAGSIRSVEPLLRPEGMEGRARRGMTVAGAVNAVAGFLGVVGPVDFSLSPGVIAATGCGSRFPLVPAGAMLLAASFSPALLGVAASVPHAVVGAVLVYALSGQVAAGLSAAFAAGPFSFEDGLVLGLPLLLGSAVSILPPPALAGIPLLLRPVAGNGFVVGVVAVLLLDRLFRRRP